MRRIAYTIAVLVSIGLLGGSEIARPLAGAPATTVRIRDMQFQPSSVRIKVGESVTWTNGDDRDHHVSATDRSFDSGNLKQGSSFTHRFTKAGSFDYTCTYHPRMRGTVQVDN